MKESTENHLQIICATFRVVWACIINSLCAFKYAAETEIAL